MRMDDDERKENILHILRTGIVVLLLIMVVICMYLAFIFGRQVFTDRALSSNANAKEYVLVVTKGESSLNVGWDLQTNGIIESGLAFVIQTKLYQSRIDPGEYTVNSSQSSKDIVKYLGQQYKLNHQGD